MIILVAKNFKITWASSLILDVHLHRTTQIEVLKNIMMMGNDTLLIGMRSSRAPNT